MTIRYLVDADWAIHHLNGHPAITQRLQDLQAEGLGLSVAALAEIYEGVYYSRDPEQSEQSLLAFLESVSVIGIDEETAKIFARERGRLRKAGMLIGDVDLFIAATAVQQNATLLTNNRSHFERIDGLQIESV
jgi:tRNA(fMet)-specific endonuclease VapC